MRKAAQEVFGTVELLEQILLALPPERILVTQRVHSTFRDAIASSLRIQQQLCFKAVSLTDGGQEQPWLNDFFSRVSPVAMGPCGLFDFRTANVGDCMSTEHPPSPSRPPTLCWADVRFDIDYHWAQDNQMGARDRLYKTVDAQRKLVRRKKVPVPSWRGMLATQATKLNLQVTVTLNKAEGSSDGRKAIVFGPSSTLAEVYDWLVNASICLIQDRITWRNLCKMMDECSKRQEDRRGSKRGAQPLR